MLHGNCGSRLPLWPKRRNGTSVAVGGSTDRLVMLHRANLLHFVQTPLGDILEVVQVPQTPGWDTGHSASGPLEKKLVSIHTIQNPLQRNL